MPTGFRFFWACWANLVGAGLIRFLLCAPRPFAYDHRLVPLTDREASSHGFPSLETHMAVVVAGWWAEYLGGNDNNNGGAQILAWLVAGVYIALVGFTRSLNAHQLSHLLSPHLLIYFILTMRKLKHSPGQVGHVMGMY